MGRRRYGHGASLQTKLNPKDWVPAVSTAKPIEIFRHFDIESHGFVKVNDTYTWQVVSGVNTFDAPNAVVPKPVSAKVQGGKLALKLEPKSVTVVSVEQ